MGWGLGCVFGRRGPRWGWSGTADPGRARESRAPGQAGCFVSGTKVHLQPGSPWGDSDSSPWLFPKVINPVQS